MSRFSPMLPKWKTLWLKALRSGKYKQGKGYLNASGQMCCLGVLCDLINSDEWKKRSSFCSHIKYFRGVSSFPDATVMEETGLTPPKCDKLANMNDNGDTFAEIADYIEKNF